MLAEAMLEDIPLTEAELENKVYELANDENNFFTDIALELWSQVQGTTIHEFYNRPIKEVLQMYSTVKILQELMQQQEVPQQVNYGTPQIEFEQPAQQQAPAMDIENIKSLLGKNLDE